MFMINVEAGKSLRVEPKDSKIKLALHEPFTGDHIVDLSPQEAQSLATALRVYGELLEL